MATAIDALSMSDLYKITADYLGISVEWVIFLFLIISIWSLIWKGLALWKSARKNHLIWFVILLFINTIGILEILYIYVFSEMKFDKSSEIVKKKKR